MKRLNIITILIFLAVGVGVWYFTYKRLITVDGFDLDSTKNKAELRFSQPSPIPVSGDKVDDAQRKVTDPPPTPPSTVDVFIQYGPEELWKDDVRVATSHVIHPNQSLPLSMDFAEETIIITDINVERKTSYQKSGFSVYLTLSDDSRIGFRYTDSNPLMDTDGCLGDSSCGGILAKEIKQREEEVDDPRAEKKVVTESIGVVSFKYDFNSGNWHSLKIGRIVYEELLYPGTIHSK